MEYKQKLDEAARLFAQAKAILTDPNADAAHKASVQDMIGQAQALKAEAMQLKTILEAGLDIVAENKATDGAKPPSGEFKKWGDFLFAVWASQKSGRLDPRLSLFADELPDGYLKGSSSKDMSGGTLAGGGALIPQDFLAQLQAVMGENSIVRSRATIIPMRRREVLIPVLDQTGTTAGIPHWFGGMKFYWEEEGGEKTESDPKFNQIKLAAHKLIGFTRASDELLDDSAISLEAFLSGPLGFAGGVAWMEDIAFLNGTGAGQPLGVIPAGATYVQARAVAGAVGYADFANMVEHFLPSGKGVWVISQSCLSEIIQMNGPAGNPSYIWQPNARDGIPGTLLGYPVIWCEKSPLLGTKGDVLLADFRYYLVGDRQATTVESTKFEKWAYDKTSWRVVHRVDGQPWLEAPLTYQDGTTQVSPFVVLDHETS